MILPATDADFASLAIDKQVQGYPAVAEGIAPEPILAMLRGVASRVRPICDPAAWWIVEDGEVVGLCSITAAPSAASIDIGYGIAASRRRRGFATSAVGDVVQWAKARKGLEEVTAETSVENLVSQRVLEQNGFVRIGERTDPEDGDLICWRVSVTA